MKLTRRNFLAWAGLSAVGAVACDVFQEGELTIQSPRDLPEDLVKGRDNWYATLADPASGGEGVIVRVMEGRAKKIRGNPKYPVNQGKQGPRAEAGLQALYHPDRIAGPMRRIGPRGSGQFKTIDWQPEALEILRREVAARRDGMVLITEPLRGTLARIAGQFATSLGGRHLGFAALDRNTEKAAIKAVFGQDLLPDFDLAQANYVLSFGADFLSTWGASTRMAAAYGEFRQGQGRESRGKLVQVDPRFSMTAANADQWLPIKPGTEGFLALSLAQVILSENLTAPGVDIDALTNGQGAAALAQFAPEQIAGIGMLELPRDLLKGQSSSDYIRALARDFAGHRPAIALGGDSAGAHSNGGFNLQAIYALNYLVGSVGQPGGLRFNPRSPLPDLPATATVGSLADWQDIIGQIRNGATRLLLIHNANPVYGLPQSAGFAEALNRDDLFIVSFSSFMDETTIMADLILPDRVYLEGWGDDLPEPGPGYQVVGMQQPVVNPLGDLNPRSFGDLLLSVAQDLGQENALPWQDVQAALRENAAALYNLNRGTSRQVDSPDALWQLMLRQGGWWDETRQGVAPEPPQGLLNDIASRRSAANPVGDGDFHLLPFAHNSLGDGSNAHLPWMQALPDPVTTIVWQTWAEMNSRQAERLGWREGDVVRIESPAGRITALLYPNPALPPNVVAVPLGQGRRAGSAYATGGDERESSNVLDLFQVSPAPEPDPNKPDQTGNTESEEKKPRPPGQTETGSLAWAGLRVRVTPTGESLKVAKFEGAFPAREIALGEGEEIVKVTTGGAH